jgi:hypothetical protein
MDGAFTDLEVPPSYFCKEYTRCTEDETYSDSPTSYGESSIDSDPDLDVISQPQQVYTPEDFWEKSPQTATTHHERRQGRYYTDAAKQRPTPRNILPATSSVDQSSAQSAVYHIEAYLTTVTPEGFPRAQPGHRVTNPEFHGVEGSFAGRVLAPNGPSASSRTHNIVAKARCHECGKSYVHRQSLYRHKASAHQENLTPCPICRQEFRRRDVMKAHHKKKICHPFETTPDGRCIPS